MATEKLLIDLWGVNMDEVDTSDCTDVEDILSAVITYLSEQPTVDAVEVVHGRWEKCWQEKSRHYFCCSNCQTAYMDGVSGAIAPEYGSRAWRYCPNCGAKMDGGKGDGK